MKGLVGIPSWEVVKVVLPIWGWSLTLVVDSLLGCIGEVGLGFSAVGILFLSDFGRDRRFVFLCLFEVDSLYTFEVSLEKKEQPS
jgi:hypothetical protein